MSSHEEWVAARNKFWMDPAGFLAVNSMHWLSDQPQNFADVSGLWWAEGLTVRATGFEGNPEEQTWELKHNGEVTTPMAGGVLEIASRGAGVILRPRLESSPLFAEFKGIESFDYDPALKVEATLVPNREDIPVDSIIGDIGTVWESAGTLNFNLQGHDFALIGFTRPKPGTLWVIFKDATSGRETYGTGRHLIATQLDADRWQLDFNKASNFPCAYTDFATCPLAPRQNVMPIEIRGGEKKPGFRRSADGVIAQ